MDQECVDLSIDYHGVGLVDHLHNEGVPVQLPSFLALSSAGKNFEKPRY